MKCFARASTIAQVEWAARRFPRLSPDQFADCVASLDGAGEELMKILMTKLITPLLSGSEQQQFEKKLQWLHSRRAAPNSNQPQGAGPRFWKPKLLATKTGR